jgi:hypothetical protein
MAKHEEPEREPTMTEVLLKFAEIQQDNQRLQRETLEQQKSLALGAQHVQEEQLKQTKAKSLASPPLISAFNPRGEKDFPMPFLKCEVYAPWKMWDDQHSLDREEVELFNLLDPGEYHIEMVDGSQQLVCVVGVRNSDTGRLERLSLLGPKDEQGRYAGLFTQEKRQSFPALRQLLRQMIGEEAAAVVVPIATERARVARGELAVSVGA